MPGTLVSVPSSIKPPPLCEGRSNSSTSRSIEDTLSEQQEEHDELLDSPGVGRPRGDVKSGKKCRSEGLAGSKETLLSARDRTDDEDARLRLVSSSGNGTGEYGGDDTCIELRRDSQDVVGAMTDAYTV